MPSALLFDLDGTLIDSLADLASAVNQTLAGRGLPTHPEALFRQFVGDGMRVLIERALPPAHRDAATVDECVKGYLARYAECWHTATRPYTGIPEVLDEARRRGIKTGVISNKPDQFTQLCCKHFFPAHRFDLVFGQRDHVPRKPAPDAALEAADILGAPIGACWYLGDSGIDMQFANAAGMKAIGVTWGFRGRDELAANGAQALLDRPGQLWAVR